MDPKRNTSDMFGKVYEPISAGERTKKLRNKHIYKTRQNDTFNTFNDTKTTLLKTNSYNHLYNLYDGFIQCKKENVTKATDINDVSQHSNCFVTWKDDETDAMDNTTINHWFLSKIDYSVDPLTADEKAILTSDEWPYKAGVLTEFFNDNHRYFNPDNLKNYNIYVDDFKYGANMTNYN